MIMMRVSILTMVCAALFAPQVLSCAESRPADRTIDSKAPAGADLVTTLEIELSYGEDDAHPGFRPAGNEAEAVGPDSIEVGSDGRIAISDPVNRRLLSIAVDATGDHTVTVAGRMPSRPEADSGGVPTATRTEKRSGEAGDVVFVEDDAERRVEIPAGGPLASLRLIGVDRKGRAFVLLERFVERGMPQVDREVLVVRPDGELVARRALPDPPLVRPFNELYLTPAGDLYRLAANADGVRIERMEVRP